ncbi:MAG: DinB family protein [Anaerolineales bacterium]
MLDPHAIRQQLDSIRAETWRRFEGLTQAELDWRPPSTPENNGGWSLGEMFLHIALDEHYLREQIARPLLEGIAPPDSILYIPPPPAYGLPKEAIRFWFERARALTQRLLMDWPAKANLDLRHDGGLVEVAGGPPMNGAEWLEGFGGHEAFHHRQIDAVIALVREQVMA